MSAALRIKVNVTSDPVCPFCLLGIRQFQLALHKWQEANHGTPVETVITLLPYQLQPQMDDQPFPRNDWGEKRRGKEGWQQVLTSLKQQYAEVGLDYHMNAMVSGTRTAHRLTQYALDKKGPSANFAVGMDIMRGYHIDGIAPSDRNLLAGIAVKNGLFAKASDAVAWLNGLEEDAEVQKLEDKGVAEGIRGVPHFVFQDKYATSGAQGVDAFYQIIDQVVQKSK